MGAVVFLLCIAAFLLIKQADAARCPRQEITKFRRYEREGLKLRYRKKKKVSVFRSKAYDSHIVLQSEGGGIRALQFEVTGLRRNRKYPEKIMEVFYDTGDGFREEQCVKVRLRLGTVRVDFDTPGSVKRVRVDFFNNTGCRVGIRRITLNPGFSGDLRLFAAVAAISLLICLLVTLSAPLPAFALGLVFWAAVNLTAGIPYLRDTTGKMLAPYLVFMAIFLFLFCTLLLPEGKKKEILFTAALLTAAFAVYYYWARITPYAEGPDEAMRHDVVYYIAQHRTLPAGYDPEVRNRIWGFSYAYYPILPYIIGGYLEYIPYHTGNPSWMDLVLLARMVSVASGVLTVFFASRLGAILFRGRPVRYLLPMIIAFLPEFAFINTYVNNDAMAIMTTAMILYYWARGCAHDWRLRDAAGLSVGMGLCALTYYNCYGYILMSIPLFFASAALGRRKAKEIAKLTAFIVLVTFCVCGWWFIRNAVLYSGDLLGRNTLNHYAEIYAQEGYKPSQLTNPMKEGESLVHMLREREWVTKTLRSFVAMFSTYSLRARPYVYAFYKVFFGLGLIGSVICGIRFLAGRGGRGREWLRKAVFWICAVLALFIVLGLAVYYSYAVDFQPQGRYILPCVLPLGCLLAAGCGETGRLAALRLRSLEAVITGVVSAVLASLMLRILLDTIFKYYV